jgi:uncharacterized protein
MQFVVIGHDGSDQEAVARRLSKREEHLQAAEKMKQAGTLKFATAILDDDGKMIGSIMVVDYPSRQDLDQWLKIEPYILGDVWRAVEVKPCRVAPMFQD